MKALHTLFEGKKPLRPRVEIYVFKNKDIYMLKDKRNNLRFPGGGIDDNESFDSACQREAREELGVSIKNIKKISNKTFEVDWTQIRYPSPKVRKRLFMYSGSETFFYKANFDKENTDTFEDSFDVDLVPVQKVIHIYNQRSKNKDDFFGIRAQMLQKAIMK